LGFSNYTCIVIPSLRSLPTDIYFENCVTKSLAFSMLSSTGLTYGGRG